MILITALSVWLVQPVATDRLAALIERVLTADATPITSYRAYRHLEASTRGGKICAEMDVMTTFDAEKGLTFRILAESGSPLIRRRVLLEALRTEQKATLRASSHEAALTLANYQFGPPAAPDEHVPSVDVRARRKSAMLVNGTLFFHPERIDLERVEGELAERPSFWTRRVRVTRRYDRIAGVHVPIAMESTADVRIVGVSTFSMTYRYVEINGQKVATEEP